MSSRQDVQKRRGWAERLERFRTSGLTVSRFCASQRVSVNTFYYWASRLRTDSTAASSAKPPPSRPRGKAAELGHERVREAHAAAGTTQPALVRFQFNEAVEISVRQVRQRGYTPHIPRKINEPPKPKNRRGKARRWKVERTHSWLNRARRLLIRWEKKVANYLGFLHLQFAIVALRTGGVLG
jgi:transposase